MGINKETLDFIEKHIKSNKIKMVELGNQYLREISPSTGHVAKYYFESKDIDHVSIDINGKDDSISIDLSELITDTSLIKKFDLLTNCGTSEHIDNQYVCWKNIHNLVKSGGTFIHLVPLYENWFGHGRYKYTETFFKELSKYCNYKILELFIRKSSNREDLICCSMVKNEDNEFIKKGEFVELKYKRK